MPGHSNDGQVVDLAAQYTTDVADLVEDCHSDWVGMSAITATAGAIRCD